MITIPDFDSLFKNKVFTSSTGTQYVCIGYGDCNNAPYVVGVAEDKNTKKTIIRTFLFKDVEFLPVTT